MSNHFLKMVLDDGFQGPHVEFECKAGRFAECRRRPVDKQQESWGPDDELDGGNPACSYCGSPHMFCGHGQMSGMPDNEEETEAGE